MSRRGALDGEGAGLAHPGRRALARAADWLRRGRLPRRQRLRARHSLRRRCLFEAGLLNGPAQCVGQADYASCDDTGDDAQSPYFPDDRRQVEVWSFDGQDTGKVLGPRDRTADSACSWQRAKTRTRCCRQCVSRRRASSSSNRSLMGVTDQRHVRMSAAHAICDPCGCGLSPAGGPSNSRCFETRERSDSSRVIMAREPSS